MLVKHNLLSRSLSLIAEAYNISDNFPGCGNLTIRNSQLFTAAEYTAPRRQYVAAIAKFIGSSVINF